MHQIDYKRIVFMFTLALTFVSIGLSLYGGWLAHPTHGAVDWLDIVYHTFKYFKLDDRPPANVWLAWARVLAPLATFSVLLQLVLEFFGNHVSRLSNRRQRDHIVVCGLGSKGMAFVQNIRAGAERTKEVIAVERDPSDAQVTFCRQHHIRLVRGDCALDATHLDAATHHAAYVVVATGSDEQNLRVATRLCETMAPRAENRLLRVFTSIREPSLWNELSNSAAIRRLWPGAELIPFSLPLLAARQFFWQHPLYSYADIRDQACLHVVFVGFGEYAASLLIQMLRSCVYKEFAPPRVSVLVTGAAKAREKFERHFGGLLKDEPGLGTVLSIDFEEFDFERDALDATRMGSIERNRAVSAIVIDQDTAERALAVTLCVRDAMRLADRWRAPVFVRSGASGLSARIFIDEAETYRFDAVIVPFGGNEELCDVSVIEGEMERLAQRIHTRYQLTRAGVVSQGPEPQRAASARDWAALPETYRQANRRAADHVKAKLASAGLYIPPGYSFRAPTSLRLSDRIIERLSMLEHYAWATERRIDGWVPHPWRDDARKLHDNLIAYDDLPNAVKDYDRDQIKLIDEHVLERVPAHKSDASLVREDHWIGLIGANVIDEEQAQWLSRTLREEVLPRLVARSPDALFTFVTPLAPGSDAILTSAALGFFAAQGHVHRLIVVEGVPARQMLADYAGSSGENAVNGFPASGADLDDRRAAFFANAGAAGTRLSGWRVDLTDPARDYRSDPSARRDGYAVAGSFIARRTATLIAAADLTAARKRGGTIDTLCERQSLRAPDWPVLVPRGTVVLDIARRAVVHDPPELPVGVVPVEA